MGRRVLGFDSGFAAEGCGIDAFGVDEYKDSVTGLLSCPTVILKAVKNPGTSSI